jgi:hypothetical protein
MRVCLLGCVFLVFCNRRRVGCCKSLLCCGTAAPCNTLAVRVCGLQAVHKLSEVVVNPMQPTARPVSWCLPVALPMTPLVKPGQSNGGFFSSCQLFPQVKRWSKSRAHALVKSCTECRGYPAVECGLTLGVCAGLGNTKRQQAVSVKWRGRCSSHLLVALLSFDCCGAPAGVFSPAQHPHTQVCEVLRVGNVSVWHAASV